MFKLVKNVSDFVLSLVLIILLFPLMAPIILGLLFTGEGYVWYLQNRVGYKNKIFKIWKFATMLKDSPNMPGGAITLKKDPRITPLGGFLRKTKINELPQLINILKGDMSFVGPRPVMKEQSFDHYPPDIQSIIFNVKPGITGIGSIFFRDEEELMTKIRDAGQDPKEFYINEIYPFKGELEKWYQENYGFFTDMKILLVTAWVVLFPKSTNLFKLFRNLPKRPF